MPYTPIPFTQTDYMTPLANFLAEYPQNYVAFQPTTPIDFGNLDVTPAGMGNLLNYVGQPPVQIITDVIGNVILRKRINSIFTIRRNADYSPTNAEIYNFLAGMADWINVQGALRKIDPALASPLIPKFSDTEYEDISSTGGVWMGRQEFGDEFQIQIHNDFDKTILREEI